MNERILIKYQETISEIVHLQKQLFSIEEDESLINDIWDLFENNSLISLSDKSIYYKYVMLLVKFAINQNPEKIVLYVVFISEFYSEIKKHFTPYELVKLYQNEPSILNAFLTNQVISIEDIAHYLNNESIIENFKDEILENSIKLLENSNSLKSTTNIEYLIGQIKSKQNENKGSQNEEFDDDTDLVKFIKEDDIDSFQSCVALSNIDINKVLIFQKRYSLDHYRSLSLIELAAKSNSIKIFKFLFLQPKIQISPNLIIFAVHGGNYDIIHMCENKFVDIKFLSMNIIKEAIKMHQNEIFY